MKTIRKLLCLIAALLAGAALHAADALAIAVTADHLRFTLPKSAPPRAGIREIPLHTSAKPAESRVAWLGDSAAGATIARFDGARDRLFARFQLFDPVSQKPLGDAQYVTDFSALPVRTLALPRPANKKGLACIVDDADAVAAGTLHANENIDIANLIDWRSAEPALSFEFEGRKVGLFKSAVDHLDRDLRARAAAGIEVTGILLNYQKPVRGEAAGRELHGALDSPLLHPRTDPRQVPSGPAAFNTATPEGIFLYRAIVRWLIERYTRDDAAYGRMAGLVIGNELQSHWMWYHMGEATQEEVMRDYITALRIADLTARGIHRDFRIYISLEHHWSLRGSGNDALREISGMEIMRMINESGKREGEFPWNVAFHPYPENLFEPRFWNDRTALLRLDSPRITFKNIEVLAAFMRQPAFLYQGRSRHIALTEQGFHCPKGDDGEQAQAAAFAYAFKKISAIPEIDSFIYHRHVDHPNEGGLKLGLREYDPKAPAGMGRKRLLWDVFQKAGTPDEDSAFAFALPIVGRRDWSEIVATKLDASPIAGGSVAAPLFDFVANRKAAKVENTLAFEYKRITKDAGWLASAIQQHPREHGVSRATWSVAVPSGKKCVLRFTALLNHAESKGAGFAVKIDGKTVFDKKLAGMQSERAEIDLAPWAGKEAVFEFDIDPLDRNQFAWATWVEPRIEAR